MIKVRCRTNLDDFKREQWPNTFVCRPEEGDKVQAKSGAVLKICNITHAMEDPIFVERNRKPEPYLIIELHK